MNVRAIRAASAICCVTAVVFAVGCGPLDYKGPKADEGRVTDQVLEKDSSSAVGEDDTVMKYEGEPELIWKAGNDGAIDGMGGTPPLVHQDTAYLVTEVYTYHSDMYGENMGPAGTISLEHEDGTVYGPWQAELYNGVYWVARPAEELPAGTYTLIDSNPATWAQNSGSGGTGMGWANGIPAE